MHILLLWLGAYVIPAAAAYIFIKFLPRLGEKFDTRNTLITHAALLVSICLSQYFIYSLGYAFPWSLAPLSLGFYGVGVACAFYIIGTVGFWYSLSALTQQLTLLSIAFLLLTTFPLYLTVLLVVPIFTLSHLFDTNQWLARAFLVSLWGIAALVLFSLLHNIWLIAALHSVLGALFIKTGVLYPSKLTHQKAAEG